MRKPLSEQEIFTYFKKHNLDASRLYCKDCGAFLLYENAKIFEIKKPCPATNKQIGDLVAQGLSFLSEREFNGQIFHLCRCRKCVEAKFPNLKNVKNAYSFKAAKYTQYAFDVPDDIFYEYSHSRQAVTEDKMISKYGEEEGKKRWKQYCEKQAMVNTFDYKHEKFGMSKDEFKAFNKSRACTLENFIKRHGEDLGQKKWDKYCQRQRYTTSLQYFKEKYGDVLGQQLYDNFEKSRMTYGGASQMANNFFNELIKDPFFHQHECFYDVLNYEFCVDGYRVDFYDKTSNIVIEFNGDVWHANPDIFKDENEAITVFSNKQLTAKEIRHHDEERIRYVKNALNCAVFIIWENDVKKNGIFTEIERLINLIKASSF